MQHVQFAEQLRESLLPVQWILSATSVLLLLGTTSSQRVACWLTHCLGTPSLPRYLPLPLPRPPPSPPTAQVMKLALYPALATERVALHCVLLSITQTVSPWFYLNQFAPLRHHQPQSAAVQELRRGWSQGLDLLSNKHTLHTTRTQCRSVDCCLALYRQRRMTSGAHLDTAILTSALPAPCIPPFKQGTAHCC